MRLVADQINVAQNALDKQKPDVATVTKAVDTTLARLSTVVRQYVLVPLKARHWGGCGS